MDRLPRAWRAAVGVASVGVLVLVGCAGDLDSGDGSDSGGGGADLAGGGGAGDLAMMGGGGDGGGNVDGPGPQCIETPFSTFGSVGLRFVNPKCRFTLAEAAAGIDFHYELVVERDVPGVVPIPGDGCSRPDASGLILFERVTGGGQNWCRCDVGLCQEPPKEVTSIVGGRYPYKLRWSGRNWNGPSDTNQREGAAFPPGTYEVLVTASGQYMAGGMMLPFTVRDVLVITLVP